MALPDILDYGPQPLHQLMEQHGIDNQALVANSADHLTHKQVGKARKGRRLTRHLQDKVVVAFNKAAKTQFKRIDLFNYDGG